MSSPGLGAASAAAHAAPAPLEPEHNDADEKWEDDPNDASLRPHNNLVDAMLTDLYQITMMYAYWKSKRHEEPAVFDLFFRKNPFKGEFTIFAGLEDVLRFVRSFKFTKENCEKLALKFPDWDAKFWAYLESVSAKSVRVFAIPEGTIVFPRVPLMRVEGHLGVCQLLETTILVLVNFASLITTNAARHRLAVGPSKVLLEFGLRRAQGPDGAMTASRYAYVGGFDGTSNVKAGVVHSLSLSGTHAHSFVASYKSFDDLPTRMLASAAGKDHDFVGLVLGYRKKAHAELSNTGELAAFAAYAQAFPRAFLALIDTYDTLESGLRNFIVVSLALCELGYTPRGVRLDSGDLAYLSKRCRVAFAEASDKFGVQLQKLTIVASNDLSEEVLYSLKEQGHEIDTFGVGTNLVTCSTQPALGCVYKLVEVRGDARMKISQDTGKVTIPGRKDAYRLFNSANEPVLDLLVASGGDAPQPQQRVLCRAAFDSNKRVFVTPTRVELLHQLVWDGRLLRPFPSLEDLRKRVSAQVAGFRVDHLRYLNPTPYKISLSAPLFAFMHELWLKETPILEIV